MHGPGYEKHPDHKVGTQLVRGKVEVYLGSDKIAESLHALEVIETGHEPVLYIPRADLKDVELIKTERQYHCPFKGEAEFFTIRHGDVERPNAAWAYDHPYEEVEELKDHVAFYPNKVDDIRVLH